MTCSDAELTMTIDGKKNRLRIAKPTMKVLGIPSMVQLLYNPIDKLIVIRAAKEQTPGGQELYIHLSKPGGDYDIYSLPFVRRIQKANPELLAGYTYRFYGEAHEKERLVVFSIGTLERIDND